MKFKPRIISDTANVSATTMVIAGTQLLETIILARMLVPEEMGLVAAIAVIIGFVRSIADLGVSNALIHFQNTSRAVFSTLFWVLLVFGTLIFSVFLLGRPVFSHFLPDSELVRLSSLIGVVFLVSPAGYLYQFFLYKVMRFRRIGIAESASRCCGTMTVFFLAVNHFGVFSYVAGQVVYGCVKSLLFIAASFRLMPISFTFDFPGIRPYLRFGMFQMGERVVNFFASNIDYIIIGKFLGARELGFYKIAYELVTVPLRLINPIFTMVALPRFAKSQNDDGVLREGVIRVLRLLSLVSFPLLFGLAACAQVFIPVVYGPGWERAVPLLWLLTAMGLLKILGNIGGSVIITKGRVKTGFLWNCIIALCNCAVFLAVVRHGVWAVAAAYSAASLIYLLASFRSYYTVTIGLTLGSYVRSFAMRGWMGMAMGAAVYSIHLALAQADLAPFMELSVLVLSGSAVYGLLNGMFARKELAGLISGIRGANAAAKSVPEVHDRGESA